MTDRQVIVQSLWAPFVGQISAGGPVFFSFSSELLEEIFEKSNIAYDGNAVRLICDKARELFDVVGDEAVLLPGALAAGQEEHSPAILLVCQQVLAVEEMVREPSGYTENAYFPRLRRLMSSQLQPASLNPFSFPDFESIWRTLAKEVRAVPGATEASITFRFGVESGINKARAFPLSQGLLSLEDLRGIVSAVGQKRLSTMAPGEIWKTLKRNKGTLGRRGQRLIGLNIFKDRVIDQVRGYALRSSPELAQLEIKRRRSNVDVVIFKDSVDWLTTVYRAYLVEADTGRRVFDDSRIEAEFESRFSSNDSLLLTLDEFGDSWSCSAKTSVIRAGQTFLVAGLPSAIEEKIAQLQAAGLAGLSYSRANARLDAVTELFIAQVAVPDGIETEVTVRNGGLVSATRVPLEYCWLGGIAIDARRQKFIREALPTAIAFGAEEYGLEDLVAVDSHRLGLSALLQSIRVAVDDFSVEIEFPQGRRARLGFAVARDSGDESMGFLVDEVGAITPVLDRINDGDFAIIGCKEIRRDGLALSPGDCGRLLEALRDNAGVLPRESEIESIGRRLESSRIPSSVRKMIRDLLGAKRHLPAHLLQSLT